ncbi:hypothetical protein COT48_04255 [Candidatus Woesearchaeota archaeon CG08_land_8_20_14_0_20_47_9]|nr:MAG: hypothetical protein AUJ69_04480 [Candidatus Woesearchaeota archaeon CG1_02_47_18]PIN75462.1 MAG: hypothetical protein COV22_00825 [Candidatus Woesearchaeota archaeon CG10_big_fil_rev_8_21_14_0_10_47_5]PIO03579.1 MAG: hypothetical protein COT48_04255 [Candidatus Woesearchaeota archaeon CG08_land_8_20_14_0_20_47_9]HII29837.1 hypothetical protein [Candidatus Woesearchaeota archaeon]
MTSDYEALIRARNKAIFRCFIPECAGKRKTRSDYTLRHFGGFTEFSVKADDAVALRATINSITALLSVIERVSEVE